MGEDTPLLTAELIVDGAVPKEPGISPDGRWVAYVVAPQGQRKERRLSGLWLAVSAACGSPPRTAARRHGR